jgi:hypothetical protein
MTGKPYRAWMEENVFRPLGMANTHVRDDYREVIPNVAWGYLAAPGGGVRRASDNMTSIGSSSIWSTADDLAKWLINFDTAAVGGKKVFEMMETPGTLNNGAAVHYGFGLAYGRESGHRLLNHSGGWAGISTFIAYFPDDKVGLAVLSNNPGVDAAAVYPYILAFVGMTLPPGKTAPPAPQPLNISPAALDAYGGHYRLAPDEYLLIKRYGPTLTSQVTKEGPSPMSPGAEPDRWTNSSRVAIQFRRDGAGKVVGLDFGGRRAELVDPSRLRPPKRLVEYVGKFDSDELNAAFEIVLKDGLLELQHGKLGNLPLTWLWHEEFGSTNGYLGTITFERDHSGRVTGLVVNGDPRNRNLRFVKRKR